MSEANKTSESLALAKRLAQMSPEEFITLIDGICLTLEELDLPFHGGINATNISLDENGNVTLGEPMAEENVNYTAGQIEYVAPEVFWDNERSKQADVYSIGMLMYAWSNGGCLPFLYPDATATDRAEALRRKMSGESFEKTPVSETLNKIIGKATAFKAANRYASAGALHEAFQAFRAEVEEEGSEAMAGRLAVLKEKQLREASIMANILAAAEAAAGTSTGANAAEHPIKASRPKKQAKPAEPVEREEKKKLSLRPLIAVLLIAAILMVAAVAMQFGEENTTLKNPNATPISGTPVIPTADPSATPDITPFVENTPVLTTPLITTPVPTIAPIVTIDTSRYNVVKADVTWNAAADSCSANGGTLVTINDKDEFAGLTALADKHGLECVWVGGFRKSGSIVWLSGQTSDYMPWAKGEPSHRDANGNPEYFLMLVKTNGVWEYKDVVDDPAAKYPELYKGKIGYIMEKN